MIFELEHYRACIISLSTENEVAWHPRAQREPVPHEAHDDACPRYDAIPPTGACMMEFQLLPCDGCNLKFYTSNERATHHVAQHARPDPAPSRVPWIATPPVTPFRPPNYRAQAARAWYGPKQDYSAGGAIIAAPTYDVVTTFTSAQNGTVGPGGQAPGAGAT